jgi:N-acetylglutamate synthase/N-acetylornithine aminotransferase
VGSANWNNEKHIYYEKIGTKVFVSFYLDCDVSNSVNTSFTVPYTSSNTVATYVRLGRAYDNVSDGVGTAVLAANSNIVNLFTGNGGAAWTNGVRRIVAGEFNYESI